jgi:MFS family permease
MLGFGQWAQQIGIGWLTIQLTDSALQIGGVLSAQGAIGIFTAPLAGYLADRYPRRLVLVWTTAVSAIQATVLAWLALSGDIMLWQLYALAVAGGLIMSLSQPARQSFVYDISTDDTLVNAVAMNSIVQNFARIAAPPLTGVMIGFGDVLLGEGRGAGIAFVFLAATKVVAVVITLQISSRTRQAAYQRGHGAIGEVIEGFRVSWQDRRVLGLIVVHTIPVLLIIPYLPYLAVLAQKHNYDAGGYGLLTAMVGCGAVLGLFVLAALGNPARKGLLMLVCFAIYALCVTGAMNSPSFAGALAFLVGVGLVNSIAFALNNTLIQLAAPNEARGRVMGVWQITGHLQPVGTLPMGFMIDRFGVGVGVGSFTLAAVALFAVFTLIWPSVRRM